MAKEHKTELHERVEYRLKESYCVEPGCEYNGKVAVQGHCFSRLDDETDRYLARLEKRAKSGLAFEKARGLSPEEYVKTLESMYLCMAMNWDSTLDALVRLRREQAELQSKVAQLTAMIRAQEEKEQKARDLVLQVNQRGSP